MDVERIFNDLGVNAIKASEMMDFFGLSTDDLNSPQTFVKLQSVIKYLGKFPDDTQRFLINKATRGKITDKIGNMFDYVNILKDKESINNKIQSIDKELSVITEESPKFNELKSSKIELSKMIENIGSELETFK